MPPCGCGHKTKKNNMRGQRLENKKEIRFQRKNEGNISRECDRSRPSHVGRASDKTGDIPGGKHGSRLLLRQALKWRDRKTPDASGRGAFLLPQAN